MKLLYTTLIISLSYAAICPAAQPADPLQAKLEAIDAMPCDQLMLTPYSASKQQLERSLEAFMNHYKQQNDFASSWIKFVYDYKLRAALKWNAIYDEYAACNNPARKQRLQMQLDQIKNEQEKVDIPIENSVQILSSQRLIHYTHASLLQAQKKESEQQAKRLLAENTLLRDQLKRYQLDDGLQIEGIPNVPGGPQPQKKRRGSF